MRTVLLCHMSLSSDLCLDYRCISHLSSACEAQKVELSTRFVLSDSGVAAGHAVMG